MNFITNRKNNKIITIIIAILILYFLYSLSSKNETTTLSIDMKDIKSGFISLKNYDIGITVLGYNKLDSTNPELLKDRVTLAIEHYKDLKAQSESPIFFVSGNDKREDSTVKESDIIVAMLVSNGVTTHDIYLDTKSKSLGESSKQISDLFSHSATLKKLIVVTSDFNLLRSQYTFQSVFIADVEIEFLGTPTTDSIKKEIASKERTAFIQSQDDLEEMGLLEIGESFGYHPIRNLPRWRMIEREIQYDQNHYRKIEEGSLIVDYGSNEGYFSLSMAQRLPTATVFSLEGEAISEYKSAASNHEIRMKELDVTNNFLCKTRVLTSMFKELQEQHHSYEYQLCLSVFHWFGMKTQEEFEDALFDHLMASKTTFLELPEAMKYTGREGQHAWKSTNIWYNGRSEVEILADLKAKYNMKMTWKILGALVHDNNTVRKVIRVDVHGLDDSEGDTRTPLPIEKLKEIYQCGKLMHS